MASSADTARISLFNRKSNLTKIQSTVGFQFEFTETATIVTRTNLADIEDLAGQLPTWQRVAKFLKATSGGVPQTIQEIAAALAVKPDTVKKAVSPRRKGSVFVHVPGPDGLMRVALLANRGQR